MFYFGKRKQTLLFYQSVHSAGETGVMIGNGTRSRNKIKLSKNKFGLKKIGDNKSAGLTRFCKMQIIKTG